MARRILVTVRPDGTIAATTQGIKGPACLDEVARIEALTGGTPLSSELTDEYQQTETTAVVDQEDVQRDHLG